MKKIYQSRARNAGRRADESENRLNTSFRRRLPRSNIKFGEKAEFYDSAYDCPLSVYIDMTVDDKLESLIISGDPTREQLEEAKLKIVSEFHEISGGNEATVNAEFVRSYYEQLNTLLLFEASMLLIGEKRYDEVVKFLNRHGVKCSVPRNEAERDALFKSVEMKYKNRSAKFKEATTRYNSLYKKGEKPTRKYYIQKTRMR